MQRLAAERALAEARQRFEEAEGELDELLEELQAGPPPAPGQEPQRQQQQPQRAQQAQRVQRRESDNDPTVRRLVMKEVQKPAG